MAHLPSGDVTACLERLEVNTTCAADATSLRVSGMPGWRTAAEGHGSQRMGGASGVALAAFKQTLTLL